MASVPQPTPPPDDETPLPDNTQALPTPGPAPQQPAPRPDAKAGQGSKFCFGLGVLLSLLSVWWFFTDRTSDNPTIEALLFALPLLLGPGSLWLSRYDEEVEKIIRRELFASGLATVFSVIAVKLTDGKIHDTIASGALSLVTGALILSSCRAFIEAYVIRLKLESHPEIEPPDATS